MNARNLTPAGRRRLLRAVLPGGILLLALAAAGVLWATKPQVEARAVEEREWAIAAQRAVPEDVQPIRRHYGQIVAGRRIDIRPQVAGRVVAVGERFVEGGILREGDLLVAIDPFTYEAAIAEREAELREARAKRAETEADLEGARRTLAQDKVQLDLRRREAQRQERLTDRGHASDKAHDDARLGVAQAEQAVIERERQIARLSAVRDQQNAAADRLGVALDRAHRDLQDARILAPADGFLVDVDGAIGKWVGVGDRVAGLVQANRLEVRFHVGNAAFARMQTAGDLRGREVELRWPGAPADAPTYRAVIERVEGQVDAASGGVNLYATIADAGPATALRPGAFVEVAVPDRRFEDVVRLPESALHDEGTVFAVIDGRLVPRSVELVARLDSDVLLRGAFDDRPLVAVTRIPDMGAGVRVQVR